MLASTISLKRCSSLAHWSTLVSQTWKTDQPLEVIIAEFIREKILLTAYDEVPHAVGVVVDAMEYNRRKNLSEDLCHCLMWSVIARKAS